MNYRNLHILKKLDFLKRWFWAARPSLVRSPAFCGLWQSLFERDRLMLQVVSPKLLNRLALETVLLPGTKDPSHGQDAPLADVVFLLQLAKLLAPKRVLEIGTYRAKTTYALAINLPDSQITSYDISHVDSPYRTILERDPRVSLRIGNFSENTETDKESPYDFIFIDAGHRLQEVLHDSEVAFRCASFDACIVWHDYRTNEFLTLGWRSLRLSENFR
jgi:hypothetical protein